MKVIEYLSRKSPATVLLMGMVMVLYVGAADYITGQVTMMVFYLVPISFVAWFAGRSSGVVTACAAGLAWYAVKYADTPTIEQHFMLMWNFFMRVLIFSGFAVLTSEVAERKKVEEALRRSQESLERRVRSAPANWPRPTKPCKPKSSNAPPPRPS